MRDRQSDTFRQEIFRAWVNEAQVWGTPGVPLPENGEPLECWTVFQPGTPFVQYNNGKKGFSQHKTIVVLGEYEGSTLYLECSSMDEAKKEAAKFAKWMKEEPTKWIPLYLDLGSSPDDYEFSIQGPYNVLVYMSDPLTVDHIDVYTDGKWHHTSYKSMGDVTKEFGHTPTV